MAKLMTIKPMEYAEYSSEQELFFEHKGDDICPNSFTLKVYHISYPKNRQSIFEKGLLPKKSDKYIIYEPRIFVFLPREENDVTFAFYYTRLENMDIWELEIDCKNLNKDKISDTKNHFWINYMVKPKLYKANVSMWEIFLSDFIN